MIDETNSSTDFELLAYVDGALSPAEREALEARLAGDAALKTRLAELAAGGRPFADAYEVLLRNAPQARLSGSPRSRPHDIRGGARRGAAARQPATG